tara:strand:- start:165 stop:269 length:105 start_codon:yes stop_codon:yes gene_type:complete
MVFEKIADILDVEVKRVGELKESFHSAYKIIVQP